MRGFKNEEYRLAANVIRGLAMDAVQKANSGHPGLPMGMADVAAVLWLKHLNATPANEKWANRDRFVLSGGHGSTLLYALLHLAEYDVSMTDLKHFRQFGSATPGHPEVGHTPGVETTTGPLGQGIANAVGMAMAQEMMAARFNTESATLFDNFTYVFCGDGDLMEGVSHEASSLAGHLKLGRLIVFYDSNNITIEGSTEVAFTENVEARYKAYGWKTLAVDGHDYEQIDRAIRKAQRDLSAPTLIICRTVIGKGSPNKSGCAKCHGEPLGADEVVLSKRELGLPEDQDFYVPEEVYEMFRTHKNSVGRILGKWKRVFKEEIKAKPEALAKWNAYFADELPEGLESKMPTYEKAVATRAVSGDVIQALAGEIPSLVGGAADLAPSTKTWMNDYAALVPGDFSGRNIQFGVREFAMAAIQNGMILYGGLRVYTSTFFVFSDYMRPAIRIAALSKIPAIYVFTHDSFYVGEDGPTHEPVEHLAALRAIPGMTVIRPSDPTEAVAAWLVALRNKSGPTALLFTRQNLDVISRTVYPDADMLRKGAYILTQNGTGTPDLIIIATGSEVGLALKAAAELPEDATVRVVSMPSWELFEKQNSAYRDSVLDPYCAKRLVIEAGSSFGWQKYLGASGVAITLDHYGASAPAKVLEKEFGFTVENVVEKARALLGK